MSDQPPTPPAEPDARPTGNAFLTSLKEHRLYRVALGYAVGVWVVLQVAAIVLLGFGAPAWVLRALMIVLALGFGAALLAGWGYDRRVAGRSLLPHATAGRVGWLVTALLPALSPTACRTRSSPTSPRWPTCGSSHAPRSSSTRPMPRAICAC